ncbi:MAG: ribosome maturation factor RimP [Actinomycetota bacterium]
MTMTGDSPLVSRLTDVVLPIVSDLGLDLYDLEFSGGLLRITVDTPPGSPGGVDVDQLSRVTRLVSRELDHLDPIPGHYTLEVSSPGLERNLRLPRHFAREVGKTVAVRLRNVVQGERRVTGILVEAGSEAFTVRQESGAERVVPYLDVDRARTVFVWEARPKPGQSKSGRRNRGASDATAPDDPPEGTRGSSRSPADFRVRDDDDFLDDEMHLDDQENAES